MKRDVSPEKIYKVLDLISHAPQASQREMAVKTGFSLGLVNLTVRRLLRTGHIKISNITKKKVEYALTAKGMSEKAHRGYAYLAKTIGTFMEYHSRLVGVLSGLELDSGSRFAILGEGEIVSLAEMALKGAVPKAKYRILSSREAPLKGEILLDCRLNGSASDIGISVLSGLLEAPAAAPRPPRRAERAKA